MAWAWQPLEAGAAQLLSGGGGPLAPTIRVTLARRRTPSRRPRSFLRAPVVVAPAAGPAFVAGRPRVDLSRTRKPRTRSLIQPWTIRGPPVATSLLREQQTVRAELARTRRRPTKSFLRAPVVVSEAAAAPPVETVVRTHTAAVAASRPRPSTLSRLSSPVVLALPATAQQQDVFVSLARTAKRRSVLSFVLPPVPGASADEPLAPPVRTSLAQTRRSRTSSAVREPSVVAAAPLAPPVATNLAAFRRGRAGGGSVVREPAAVAFFKATVRVELARARSRPAVTTAVFAPQLTAADPTFVAETTRTTFARTRAVRARSFLRAPVVVAPAATEPSLTPQQQDVFVSLAKSRRPRTIATLAPPAAVGDAVVSPTPQQQDVFVSLAVRRRRPSSFSRIRRPAVVTAAAVPSLRQQTVRTTLAKKAKRLGALANVILGKPTVVGASSTTTPPTFVVDPVVTGSAEVGETLSCTTGLATGDPLIVYTFQWQRDGSDIPGETSSTHYLSAADYGTTVRCVVTATNAYGNDVAFSNEIGPVVHPYGPRTRGRRLPRHTRKRLLP